MSKTPIQLAQMTDEAYEAYLKRQGYRGMAAACMDRRRREGRAQLAGQPNPFDQPYSPEVMDVRIAALGLPVVTLTDRRGPHRK